VRVAEVGSALVAVILSPIPLADEFVIAPGLLGIAVFIGHCHGLGLAAMPWRSLGRAAFAGLAARATANLVVSGLPGIAALANAATAFALTRAYADWAERVCLGRVSTSPASAARARFRSMRNTA
jgi:uncharacterized protein (DUF697 family)